MSKTRFTKRDHHTNSPRFWSWRDLNRRLAAARQYDQQQMDEFLEQSQAVREEVEFLLGGGLSEGAEEALTAFAEQDMVDFSIMVDLAEPVEIPGLEPLNETTRKNLQNFLKDEPWHSLAIDHDITVALALLDSVGSEPSDAPWYRYAPGMFDLIARVLNEVDKEQLHRFVGEYNALARRDHLTFPADAEETFTVLVKLAAQRLAIPPPEVRGSGIMGSE